MDAKGAVRLSLVALVVLGVQVASADALNRNTDWMAGKIGIFQHHLYNTTNAASAFEQMKGYDAKAVAAQLQDIGANHFCITLLQVYPTAISPNAVYDAFSAKADEPRPPRDIPAELIRELKRTDVKFMLYAPAGPARFDKERGVKMGWRIDPRPNRDLIMTREGAANWAKVLEEWSVRYGRDVAGWWIDGCFPGTGFTNAMIRANESYAAALKKGNPDTVIALNSSFEPRYYVDEDDFTSGEINEPQRVSCYGRWVDGRQWHMLTYLFKPMCFPETVRFTDGEWIDCLRPILSRGGCVTLDGRCEFPSGLIPVRYAGQLKRIIAEFDGKPQTEETRRAAAIERCVRRVTDPLMAANTMCLDPLGHKFLFSGFAWGGNRPDVSRLRMTAGGEEIWTEAIQATLDAKGTVYLPPREKPYLLDGPIVLRGNQAFGAAHALAGCDGDDGYETGTWPHQPGRQAALAPVKGYAGKLLVVSSGAKNVYVHGLTFADAESPAVAMDVDGLVLCEFFVRRCRGTVLEMSNVSHFRIDAIRCDENPETVGCGVHADAKCHTGLLRNVQMVNTPDALAVRSEGSDIVAEANLGRVEFTGAGVNRD